ncbi:MAG: hypothetical protein H7199_03075 [Burkholderiales bacterium]|nr:hypothetical protein [Flavobacterium sp.]
MATQNSKVGKTTEMKSIRPKVEDKKATNSGTKGSLILESKMNAASYH